MKKCLTISLAFVFLFIFLLNTTSAYDTHKIDTDFDLVISSNNASECNLSYIIYPDKTKEIFNLALTKDGTSFYETINATNFTDDGVTCMGLACTDGASIETGSICVDVTINGKPQAEGIIIVIFSIIFILIIGFGLIYFLKSLMHIAELNMDLIDTAVMMATYFAMWIFYYFSFEYLGNQFMNEMLEIAISVGAVTHVFMPLVGFAISFIMTNLKAKQKARITY